MNLDDLDYFRSVDSQNFLADVDDLPDQVERAWQLGQGLTLPNTHTSVSNIVITGMGGSAIGGTLTQGYAAADCALPIAVVRNYTLPAWAGPHSLVIASSHSGNTEETLATADQALKRGAKLLAITTGGQLATFAEAHGQPVWRFTHAGQPRAAVGYSFILTLTALAKLGVVANSEATMGAAIAAMRAQQAQLRATMPVVQNPAKRLAGQLMDRLAVIIATDYLAPVARRWKGQINEVAKAWATFEDLPEMNHNTIVGTMFPTALISKQMVLFLRAPQLHRRNQQRLDITREVYMTAGFNTDAVEASGPSPLAHILTSLHFGDYVAFYLAMAYGVDPGPIPQIDYLKDELRKREG